MAQWRKTFSTLGGSEAVADPRVQEQIALQDMALRQLAQRQAQAQAAQQQSLDARRLDMEARNADRGFGLQQSQADFNYGDEARANRRAGLQESLLSSRSARENADMGAQFNYGSEAQARAAAAEGRAAGRYGFEQRALARAEDPTRLAREDRIQELGLLMQEGGYTDAQQAREIANRYKIPEAQAAEILAQLQEAPGDRRRSRMRAAAEFADSRMEARARDEDRRTARGDRAYDRYLADRDRADRLSAQREELGLRREELGMRKAEAKAARAARERAAELEVEEQYATLFAPEGALGMVGAGQVDANTVPAITGQVSTAIRVFGKDKVLPDLYVSMLALDAKDPAKADLLRSAMARQGIQLPNRRRGLIERGLDELKEGGRRMPFTRGTINLYDELTANPYAE